MYSVKEISDILGLTEHTIRFYTDKGLVPSVTRDRNNNRLFDEESINWLTGVKYLKECGMSIEAIKDYVDLCLEGNSTIEQRYQIVLSQKAAAEATAQVRPGEDRVPERQDRLLPGHHGAQQAGFHESGNLADEGCGVEDESAT